MDFYYRQEKVIFRKKNPSILRYWTMLEIFGCKALEEDYLNKRLRLRRWFHITCPLSLWVQIPPDTLEFFMWGSYPAILQNVGGSTQVLTCAQKNAGKGTWGVPPPVKTTKNLQYNWDIKQTNKQTNKQTIFKHYLLSYFIDITDGTCSNDNCTDTAVSHYTEESGKHTYQMLINP